MSNDWVADLSADELAKWEQYVARARNELIPKLQGSNLFMAIAPVEPDVKFSLELGMAIMMDKPIVVLRVGDRPVPERLARVADTILVADTMEEMAPLITAYLKDTKP